MPGPLSHLTVLDLSRVLAGPWCTQLLADLGATVIKVERPQGGDDTRMWGPPFLKDVSGADTAEAGYYLACNRGKRSVAIDFAPADGQRHAGRRARTETAGRAGGDVAPGAAAQQLKQHVPGEPMGPPAPSAGGALLHVRSAASTSSSIFLASPNSMRLFSL